MKPKVLIFSDDKYTQIIYNLLNNDEIQVVGQVNDEGKILDEISKKKADIIVVSKSSEIQLMRVCEQIYLLRPRTTIVVLTEEYQPELLHKIMQVGVNHVYPLGIENNVFTAQIAAIYSNEQTRLSALESTSTKSFKSRVISIFSTKGGVGKSSIATNFAMSLAKENYKVALLDFDIEFGDIDVMLKLDAQETISDLISEMSVSSIDTIRKYMEIHNSGVNVLCAPLSPEYADHISGSHVEKIISTIRNHYDFVIIDMASSFSEINLSAFDASSDVVVVTDTDIASLNSTKKGLVILESLLGKDRLKVVIGQDKPTSIKQKALEQALGYKISAKFPYDNKAMVESINIAKPLVMSNHSAYKQATSHLLSSFEVNVSTVKKSSFLSRFKIKKKPKKAKRKKRGKRR